MKNLFKTSAHKKGFTLVELIVIISVIVTLLSIVTINLISAQRGTTVNTTIDVFISDLKQQQIKSMVGDSNGQGSNSAYGVHLEPNQYILFKGSTYNQSDPSNSPIDLEGSLVFVNTNQDIIFQKVTGQISGTSSAIIRDTTNGNQSTIQLNTYGVITNVN